METIEIILLILTSVAILLLVGIFLVLVLRKDGNIDGKLDDNRSDIINSLNSSLELLGSLLKNSNEQFAGQQKSQIEILINSLTSSFNQLNNSYSKSAIETEQKLENIRLSVEKSLTSASGLTEVKLENIRTSVEKSITNLQTDNSKKLEEIRQTVDEKLQKTLEERLTKSFQLVSDRLEQVYKGLGEMQNLATGVGDLKRVLTNVKTQGTLGEIQLGNILEEILTSDQYEKNVATKKGSRDRVEFAIKLPGDEDTIYLPIDAKFPLVDYQNLLDAYETSSQDAVKSAQNLLIRKIKSFAKDIHDKYIDVPNTTEFGIMFLPIEGLYAEVVKSGVLETLQRDYKINIAGPTTMAALLNSLQMGFKTLAIQKRSSEVWKILGAVKTEFATFSKVLKDAQSKINQANDQLDKLVGPRTRMIQRKLQNVTALTDVETEVILPPEE
ncbi:MAG: DNA recombination protein RmuC [Bacilli bacterium]|nr:DNA recombination protein RmuC [Bacilli bacterium]